jgi:hypothetical protein
MYPNKIPSQFRTIKIIKTLISLPDIDIFHEHMLYGVLDKVLRLRNTNAKRIFHYHSSARI